MLHSKLFFFSIFAIGLFIMLGVTQAYAYAAPINVQRFQQENASVDQLITFTYTDLGTMSIKSMTIRNTGELTQEVIAHDSMSTTPNDDIGLSPNVRSVWNTNALALLNTGFNYTGTEYLIEWATMDTGMVNKSIGYTDFTDNVSQLVQISGLTGYAYSVTLLPAQDVANYYCQQHGYTLGNITAINYTSCALNVNYVVIEQSEEMQPDNDLSNGYQAIPVSAGFVWMPWMGALIKYVILAVVCVIVAFELPAIFTAIFGTQPDSAPVHLGPDIDINVNGTNGLDLWNQYVTAMQSINVTPTVSGFPSSFDLWCKAIGTAQPQIYINAPSNNTYTPPPKTILTDILAFLKDLLPLIITIIIIVAFVFGFMLLVKIIRGVSSYIPEPRKREENN